MKSAPKPRLAPTGAITRSSGSTRWTCGMLSPHCEPVTRTNGPASWSRVADRYMADAATNPNQANADYLRAWRLYYFAQWPVPSSSGKQAAYRKALDAYARHAATLDPKLETVRIPFEGGTITGYLRLPKNPLRSRAAYPRDQWPG